MQLPGSPNGVHPSAPSAPTPVVPRAAGPLALLLQELLTATVRLRAGRQLVANADAFREQVKHLMRVAEQEALRAGYTGEQVRLALYACAALLDETVLNSGQAIAAGWASKPLQDELFGRHMGGEYIFTQLRQLLAAPDNPTTADLLEVYQLCLLLGFRGRYGLGEGGELRSLHAAIVEKIERVRGPLPSIAPDWALPEGERPAPERDPWARRMTVGAFAGFVLVAGLFAGYRLSLTAGVAALRASAPAATMAAATPAAGAR